MYIKRVKVLKKWGEYEVTYEEKFIIVKEHEENHKTLKAVREEYDISKIPT